MNTQTVLVAGAPRFPPSWGDLPKEIGEACIGLQFVGTDLTQHRDGFLILWVEIVKNLRLQEPTELAFKAADVIEDEWGVLGGFITFDFNDVHFSEP